MSESLQFKDPIQNPNAFFDSESLRIRKALEFGQEITPADSERIGLKYILLVGNSKLKPENFYLRAKDYQAIGPLVYPGKSAMLDFLRFNERGFATKKERDLVSQLSFGKDSKTNDSLYIADIKELNQVGFEAYYAPVRTNGLHIRLVYKPHSGLEYPVLDDLPTIPTYPLQRLSTIWRKVQKINSK